MSLLIPMNARYIFAECAATRRPIRHYPDVWLGLMVMVDFEFQCDGDVTDVEFYAEDSGTFYFSAWRPSSCGDSWTLLGFNKITSQGEGAQVR